MIQKPRDYYDGRCKNLVKFVKPIFEVMNVVSVRENHSTYKKIFLDFTDKDGRNFKMFGCETTNCSHSMPEGTCRFSLDNLQLRLDSIEEI